MVATVIGMKYTITRCNNISGEGPLSESEEPLQTWKHFHRCSPTQSATKGAIQAAEYRQYLV